MEPSEPAKIPQTLSVSVSSVAIPTWGPDGRPSTGTLRSNLSLPDIKTIERRVAAVSNVGKKEVENHEKVKDVLVKRAHRVAHEATIYTKRANRAMPRVRVARVVLATPLSAGITPAEYESVVTERREAQREMHQDCLRRAENMRRQQMAS